MSRVNYLVFLKTEDHRNRTPITVFAEDEDHARSMGEVAAEAMYEGFHESLEWYVDHVTPLE